MENEFHRVIRRLRNAVASQREVSWSIDPVYCFPAFATGLQLPNAIPVSSFGCRRKASELATAVDFVAAEPN